MQRSLSLTFADVVCQAIQSPGVECSPDLTRDQRENKT